jgi:hypothetical protein
MARASKESVPTVAAVPAIPALPAIAVIPAIPDVPALPDLAALRQLEVTLPENIELRIPREAIVRARMIADELRLHAEARADVDVTVSEVMRILNDRLSDIDTDGDATLVELGLPATFFADLAATIQASVSAAVDEASRVSVTVPKRNRQ